MKEWVITNNKVERLTFHWDDTRFFMRYELKARKFGFDLSTARVTILNPREAEAISKAINETLGGLGVEDNIG
mgnify:CR=1 FL=1